VWVVGSVVLFLLFAFHIKGSAPGPAISYLLCAHFPDSNVPFVTKAQYIVLEDNACHLRITAAAGT